MKSINKYLHVFKLGLHNSLAYRLNFFLGMISAIFPITLQFYLWTAVFNSTDGNTVYGFTYPQMITYTVLAAVVAQVIRTGFEYEIAHDIKNGGLNRFVIQPIRYFGYRIFLFLGDRLLYFGLTLTILIAGIVLSQHYFNPGILGINLFWFVLSLFLALILNFLIFFCVSTVAFWAIEVWALFEAFRIVILILSGGIFPLDIFGPAIKEFFHWLPFTYTVYFPINVLNGGLSQQAILEGLGIQLLWIAITWLAASALWQFGTRKYVAVGG